MSIRDSTDVLQPLPLFASATLFSCALPKPIEFDELRLPQFGENVNYPCNETHRKQNTDINTENIALLLFVPPIQLSVCVVMCCLYLYITCAYVQPNSTKITKQNVMDNRKPISSPSL